MMLLWDSEKGGCRCDDDGDDHDDDEPSMLLWERRAGGRGMPRRLRPKYQQLMNLRPHILPYYGLVWDSQAGGHTMF